MDIKHSNTVSVIKGIYKGYEGELRDICKEKYVVNIMNKNIVFNVDSIFFMDIRYESKDKNGYIHVVSIKNNVITGYFKNDIGRFPIESITIGVDDKNIKQNYTNKYIEIKKDEEMYVSDDSDDDKTFVNSYNDMNQTEIDASEMEANDKNLFVKIVDIMEKLSVNMSNINPYKVINNYNSINNNITNKCSEKRNENNIKLDNDIILCNMIVFELMRSVDVLKLYIDYKGTNGFQKYFNMLKDKLITHINVCDFELSRFNVQNCQKYFKLQFMKPHKNKFYEIVYNIFRYIKYVMPIYSEYVLPFELSNDEKYIPLGNYNKNQLYFEKISVVNDVIKQENLALIDDLNSKLRIAEANNNIDMINQLKSKLKETTKKAKKTIEIKKIYPIYTFEDYYTFYMNEMNQKLNKAVKNCETNNIKTLKYIIEHFTNINVNDTIMNEHREIFKNNYLSMFSNNLLKQDKITKKKYYNMDGSINMDKYNDHFYNSLKQIKKQLDAEKRKVVVNNDRMLMLQMKTITINNDTNKDTTDEILDEYCNDDMESLFGHDSDNE
jgi:hypothetical protein